jgi:hypothetical protein
MIMAGNFSVVLNKIIELKIELTSICILLGFFLQLGQVMLHPFFA